MKKKLLKPKRMPKENEYRVIVRIPLEIAKKFKTVLAAINERLGYGRDYSINRAIQEAIEDWSDAKTKL